MLRNTRKYGDPTHPGGGGGRNPGPWHIYGHAWLAYRGPSARCPLLNVQCPWSLAPRSMQKVTPLVVNLHTMLRMFDFLFPYPSSLNLLSPSIFTRPAALSPLADLPVSLFSPPWPGGMRGVCPPRHLEASGLISDIWAHPVCNNHPKSEMFHRSFMH